MFNDATDIKFLTLFIPPALLRESGQVPRRAGELPCDLCFKNDPCRNVLCRSFSLLLILLPMNRERGGVAGGVVGMGGRGEERRRVEERDRCRLMRDS